jgi:hypothetical protein
VLDQAARRLALTIEGAGGARWQVYPTDPPPSAHDAPDPGTRMIGLEARLAAGEQRRWLVRMRLLPAGP